MTRCDVRRRLGAGVLIACGALALGSPALADDYVGNTPPNVGAGDPGGARHAVVLAESGTRAPAGRLALTGADIMGLVGFGAASVGIGAVVVRRSRPVAR